MIILALAADCKSRVTDEIQIRTSQNQQPILRYVLVLGSVLVALRLQVQLIVGCTKYGANDIV